ncbi:unnamed protein product [Rangifer tarandus platyrhynchus]|uniref:Uncharacterized protein n=1 Tax=Rangifer tarandus platyrhynchus TaxID=3082113 RepID=A0AC59Z6A8_RANTA
MDFGVDRPQFEFSSATHLLCPFILSTPPPPQLSPEGESRLCWDLGKWWATESEPESLVSPERGPQAPDALQALEPGAQETPALRLPRNGVNSTICCRLLELPFRERAWP